MPRDREEESFRRRLFRGWIESSSGFKVRIPGRVGIEYQDATGTYVIDAETMSSRPLTTVTSRDAFAVPPTLGADQVCDNVRRAFVHARWHLEVY